MILMSPEAMTVTDGVEAATGTGGGGNGREIGGGIGELDCGTGNGGGDGGDGAAWTGAGSGGGATGRTGGGASGGGAIGDGEIRTGGGTGDGRLVGGGRMEGRLCTDGETRIAGMAAGRGAGKTTCGRLALASSSFSRAISCAERTNTPAGTRVVKLGGFSGSLAGGAGGTSGLAVSMATGAAGVAGAGDSGATGFLANSCSSASAVILSIVLETVLTGYSRSLSKAIRSLLSMPSFLASSWRRMLIRSGAGSAKSTVGENYFGVLA